MTQTYQISVVNCTTDSGLNTCSSNCCLKYSGGILDPVTTCHPFSTSCSHPENYYFVVQAFQCDNDQGNNICYEKCCISIKNPNGTMALNKMCYPKLMCDGIDTYQMMNAGNIQKYSYEIGDSIYNTSNRTRGGGSDKQYLGGILGLGLLSFILIVMIIIIDIKYKRKSNQLLSKVSNKKVTDNNIMIRQKKQVKLT